MSFVDNEAKPAINICIDPSFNCSLKMTVSNGIMFANHSEPSIRNCKGRQLEQSQALVFGNKIYETKEVVDYANMICPIATTKHSIGSRTEPLSFQYDGMSTHSGSFTFTTIAIYLTLKDCLAFDKNKCKNPRRHSTTTYDPQTLRLITYEAVRRISAQATKKQPGESFQVRHTHPLDWKKVVRRLHYSTVIDKDTMNGARHHPPSV